MRGKQRASLPRVLVVDDRLEMAETTADGLCDRGFDAVATGSGRAAKELLAREPFAAVVTDLRMPEIDGFDLLAASRQLQPDRPVIVMTAHGALDVAVESIRRGAYHYITKPFKLDELVIFLERALDDLRVRREAESLRRNFLQQHSLGSVVGRSSSMREVVDLVERVADAQMPILVLGETGTGKGLIARALHTHSRRVGRPFVAINCAAMPEGLLESELFGYVKGSFTGADSSRAGLFVEASGGTLFLDEVAEMSPALQAKLLTALESGTVRPIGSSQEVSVDVRIVAATNRDLRERVRARAFREDLVYRLDVVSITIPPLRHRREDIAELLQHFLGATRERHPSSVVERFTPEALALLLDYAWPGNVRELAHVVERAVVLGRTREIGVDALSSSIRAPAAAELPFKGDVIPMREFQRKYAAWAMDKLGGNKTRVAASLGIDMKTLTRWLESAPRDKEDSEPDGGSEATNVQRAPEAVSLEALK